MKQTMIAVAAALAAMTGWAGESAEFRLDTMDGTRTARAVETIAYSTAWNGGSTATVAVDGVSIKEANAPASGDVVWNAAQSTPDTHTLTHTCGGETLTAVFEVVQAPLPDVVIIFNANGGTGTMENQTFEDGKAQKLEKNTYRKDGYVFQGWAVSANGEVVYKDEASITVGSDMTLYAVWKGLLPLTLTVDSADFSAGSIKLRWNAEDYPEGTTFKVLRTSGGETMNEVATGISESTWTDKNFLTAGTSPFDQVSYCVEPELGDISQSLRSLPVHTRNRRALCVGIDKYKEPGDDLKYCVSDAAEWRSMLRNYGGFTTGVPLDDDSAKKERILSELSKCAEAAMPGDIFVYTHSSHGDENILWCHDFALTAAEFAKALMKFPKGTGLIVILDACHSGSMPNTSPVRMMSAMPLRSATASMARSSFVESVMAEMELARSPRTSSLRTTQEGVVRETISSGSEIGWLTAVDSVQLSTDGAYSSKCLQTAGWRYGGADRGDNGGNNDGRVSFWELGVFADYWFERVFDRYEMSPQKFSADILKAVVAGSVPSVGTYGKLSAPTGVSATMDRPRRISVSWNAVPGTTKYEVRCSGDTTDIFHSTGDATAILTMLQPGDYSIYVKATNPMDVSLPSSTVPGHAAESSTSIPVVAADATTEAVTAAIDGVGFVDESAVKDAINGSAVEYAAFKEWAGSVKGAGSASSAAAGEASVIANTNAAAAYLLGAERLFENAPKIEFEEASVSDGEDGGESGALGITRPAITLSVVVKDGEAAVKCAAEKVKSLFKATSDLSDWNGAAKLEPEVSIEATDNPTTMRFKVTPGDGTLPQAFLRIRK